MEQTDDMDDFVAGLVEAELKHMEASRASRLRAEASRLTSDGGGDANVLQELVLGNGNMLSEDQVEDDNVLQATPTWSDAVRESTAAVTGIPLNANVGGSDGCELSVVLCWQSARLIAWSNVAARKGRLVRVDAMNRAIWVIPGLEPVYELHDCCIIHPATGIRLQMSKGRERPTIPYHVARVMRLINTTTALQCMPCVVCTTDGEGAGALFVCRWCLLPFHTTCSERFKIGICRHDVPEASAIRRWLQEERATRQQLCSACRHVADSGNTC